MRKLILPLLLLLIATPCFGQDSSTNGEMPFKVSRMSLGGVVGGGVPASGCNPATNEVGDRGDYSAANSDMVGELLWCILYTADCTGALGYANAYHHGTGTDNLKICIYSDNGDSTINVGDLKIGCSNAMTISTDAWGASSSKVTGSVTNGSPYWLCMITDGITGFDIHRTTSGSRTLQYKTSTGAYATPPANLDGTWTPVTTRDFSVYVEIE